MANILRYGPVDGAFDDLFRGFLVRPARFEGQPEPQIRMDVSEDENAYTVHAEIPGVKKEDIDVNIDGNEVAISAEVKRETESREGDRALRRERYYGKVSRTFTLGLDIDDAAAQAKYQNGVLELRLPKQVSVRSRRITVE